MLAEDPEFTEPVRLMSLQPSGMPQRYSDPATTIALTTAALLVLQTSVKFKGKVGPWVIDIQKKALGDGALKLLVERFLSLVK